MKAIIQEIYGPASVLKLVEVKKPTPKDDEVLVHVKATSLNAPDRRLLRGKPMMMRLSSGIFRPKYIIKGTDVSGTVSEMGKGVTRFKVGDEVYGDLADAGFDAFADYVSVKETLLVQKVAKRGAGSYCRCFWWCRELCTATSKNDVEYRDYNF